MVESSAAHLPPWMELAEKEVNDGFVVFQPLFASNVLERSLVIQLAFQKYLYKREQRLSSTAR